MSDTVALLAKLWPTYFPQDPFDKTDKRIDAVRSFQSLILANGRRIINNPIKILRRGYILLSMETLQSIFPFPDFIPTLRTQPNEVLGCLGLAISITLETSYNTHQLIAVKPKIVDLSPRTHFGDLKSSISGQLISICGHVLRVGPPTPYVTMGNFRCSKCNKLTQVHFRDGIYAPPSQCETPKCHNKFLEFDRNSAVMSDLQHVKIQEMDISEEILEQGILGYNPNTADGADLSLSAELPPPSSLAEQVDPFAAARVPRTFDMELRGGDLVESCCPGDTVVAVGIVKSVQAEELQGGRRGGGRQAARESGLHQLYLDVISVSSLRKGCRKRTVEDSSCRTDVSDTGHGSGGSRDALGKEQNLPDDDTAGDFSPSDLSFIRSLALSPYCTGLLLSSFCTIIYGHDLVKMGLLLGLFGGSSTDASDALRGGGRDDSFHTRSDIHVLVVGDPGLGKSQMLKAAATVAPRSVMVCGNTSSAAGLTVSLVREPGGGGDMSLEAGALVLADRGVCCIDELDKMTCDYHSLLEAMEQQRISVAKSGVVTSMSSRTTILAAANPAGGCYDRRKSVCENIKLPAALLSRFDLVFVMLDKPDEGRDRLISEHIMRRSAPSESTGVNSSSSSVSQPFFSGLTRVAAASQCAHSAEAMERPPLTTLSQRIRDWVQSAEEAVGANYDGANDLLSRLVQSPENMRKYVEYSRRYCHPVLTPPAAKVLQRHYLNMRASSSGGYGSMTSALSGDGTMPVTTRHLESLIRLSQARARMELREEVSESDAMDVVDLLHESLLDAVTLDTGQIDFGRKGGMSMAKQVKALVQVLRREGQRKGGSMLFSYKDIAEVASLLKLKSEVSSIIDVMRTECYLLLKGPKLYQLQCE